MLPRDPHLIPPELLWWIIDAHRPDDPPYVDREWLRSELGVTDAQINAAVHFKCESLLTVYAYVEEHEPKARKFDGCLDGVLEFLKWLRQQEISHPAGFTLREYEHEFWIRVHCRRKDRDRRSRRPFDTAAASLEVEPKRGIIDNAFRRSPLGDEFADWLRLQWPTLYRNRVEGTSYKRLAEEGRTTEYVIRQQVAAELKELVRRFPEFIDACIAKGYDLTAILK